MNSKTLNITLTTHVSSNTTELVIYEHEWKYNPTNEFASELVLKRTSEIFRETFDYTADALAKATEINYEYEQRQDHITS